jgi:hypothetical protein
MQDDADARVDVDGKALQVERRLEGRPQPPGRRERAVVAGRVGEDDGELVAAQPGQHVPRPERAGHPRAELREQQVADVVAELVVDLLEAIQVDEQQGEGAPRGDVALQGPQQRPAVGQSREIVRQRQPLRRVSVRSS